MMSLAEFSVGMKLREINLREVAEPARYAEWIQELQQQALPTDTIYHYCSEPEQWNLGMGSEGYIIVGDGQIIESVVCRMN
jgi:hypothetical protein